jgi:AraC-like DNA-binding protein
MFAHLPIIRDILYGAAQRGADLTAMCRKIEIPVADLSRSDKVVEFEKAYKTWDVAVAATGDTTLGLHLGTSTTPAILGIVGHLMQSCATLRDAFKQVCAYSAVATDMFEYSMVEHADQIALQFTPAAAWKKVSPRTAMQAVDQAMAGTLNVFFLLSSQRIKPASTSFTMRRPPQPAPYTQVFGENIHFNERANTLVFRRADMSASLPRYDRSLMATFERLAKKQLRVRRVKKRFRDEVLQCMQSEFAADVPSLEIIAARMNMSTRTFQRKLASEQLNYRELSEQASKEIAMSLIEAGNIRISDIARLMGYSEPSAFRRAVKRWTKSTPGRLMKSITSSERMAAPGSAYEQNAGGGV